MTKSCTTNDKLLAALLKVRAVSVWFDLAGGRIVALLNTGMEISFSPSLAAGLERAKPGDLLQIELSPSGAGLHFPVLDADLYVPSLLVGILQPERHSDEAGREAKNRLLQPHAEDSYSYAVQWSAEDGEYVATCSAFPSLSWLDRKPDLALMGVRDLVRSALNDLAAESQQPPAPVS